MDDFKAMVRLRLSLDASPDKYFYCVITGSVYSNIPGKPTQKLFNIYGVNKGRSFHVQNDKYMMNSKEVVFVEDHLTGEIMKTWENPFTGEENEVMHTYNDPVNIPIFASFVQTPTKLCDDTLVVFPLTFPLRYPNPVNPSDYPEYSTGDWYVACETFGTSAWMSDAYDNARATVPSNILWTRTCPWLPWMKMSSRPGGLFYIANSWKCNDVGELPSTVREKIQAIFPDFYEDPSPLTAPNQSSWTSFKNVIDKRRELGQSETELNGSIPPTPIQKPQALNKESLELLKRGSITVQVSGSASVVGASERRFPFGVKGMATVTTDVTDKSVTVSVKYEVTVLDLKTGEPLKALPNPATAEPIDVPAFTELLEIQSSADDIYTLEFNRLKHFSFVGKNESLLSMNHVALSFPQLNATSSHSAVFVTAAMPLPHWMEVTTPGEYCTLSFCG